MVDYIYDCGTVLDVMTCLYFITELVLLIYNVYNSVISVMCFSKVFRKKYQAKCQTLIEMKILN